MIKSSSNPVFTRLSSDFLRRALIGDWTSDWTKPNVRVS